MKKLFDLIDCIIDLLTGFSMLPFRSTPIYQIGFN